MSLVVYTLCGTLKSPQTMWRQRPREGERETPAELKNPLQLPPSGFDYIKADSQTYSSSSLWFIVDSFILICIIKRVLHGYLAVLIGYA